MNNSNLLKEDRKHVWHPYTSMINPLPVYHVISASGVRLTLENRHKLIDGMSSWWAAIHGYNHPVLNDAAHKQIDTMPHVMFGGLTHQPAVKLASLLVKLTPKPLQKVFFSDSGSVSVEVAIKMAIQYWYALGYRKKHRLLTVRSGYHGDTFGAMSICDPITGMHKMFKHILPLHLFTDAPSCRYGGEWDEKHIDNVKNLIKRHHEEIAAIILEPLVQGAGGMRFYSTEYLRRVRDLCNGYNILLILDEIATGFGRTGSMFACEQADIAPDIMCIGKALTGGYVSLAATLTTSKVSTAISSKGAGVLMHGPTFMGNPLACSIALASVKLLLSTPWKERIKRIEKQLSSDLSQCIHLPQTADVRVLGAIGVVELTRPVNMAVIQKRFIEKRVWIRPFGKLVYIMPPYIINEKDLSMLTTAMVETIKDETCLME